MPDLSHGLPDRETLITRNRDMLRALARAYPDQARKLAAKRVGRFVPSLPSVNETTPDPAPTVCALEKRIAELEQQLSGTVVSDMNAALRTCRLPDSAANRILRETAHKHSVLLSDMLSERRRKHLVAARHEAMYEIYARTNLSLPQIGKKMGWRDHTTIIHGIRAHASRTGAPDLIPPKKRVVS